MPTPRITRDHPSWPTHEAVYNLKQQGLTTKEIADTLGIKRGSVSGLFHRAARVIEEDPAISAAKSAVNTRMQPVLAWAKTKEEDGTSYSVLLRPAADEVDIEGAIEAALQNIQPAPFVKRPPQAATDTHNIVAMFDKHINLRVGEYGLQRCVERIHEGFADLMERAPRAHSVTILEGGDITHDNDESALTPRGKHPLSVAGSYDEGIDAAVQLSSWQIETALAYADQVEYVALIGNHDPHTARVLQRVQEARYAKSDRVTVYRKSYHHWARAWGGNLWMAYHGHARRDQASQVFPEMVRRYRQAWGQAAYCEFMTGHLHHFHEESLQWGTWRQFGPVSPLSQHDEEQFYGGDSAMYCTSYSVHGRPTNETKHFFPPEPHETYTI